MHTAQMLQDLKSFDTRVIFIRKEKKKCRAYIFKSYYTNGSAENIICPICSFSHCFGTVSACRFSKDIQCVWPLICPNRGHNLHEN